MKIFTIYKATNNITSKCYIGFDSNWPRRRYVHHSESFALGNRSYNTHFHRAIRKYGKEAFDWEIMYQSYDGDHCLNNMEPHFIKECNSYGTNGYNSTLGGDGGTTMGFAGKKHSNETLQKFRDRKHSVEQTRKSAETQSKLWVVTDPSGRRFTIKNLNQFCKISGLFTSSMSLVAKGKATHHKGWRCAYA